VLKCSQCGWTKDITDILLNGKFLACYTIHDLIPPRCPNCGCKFTTIKGYSIKPYRKVVREE